VTGEFQRYLRAKRTVDDRALDRRLIGQLREGLAGRAADSPGPLSVLEVGAGIGTMVARFLEWDVLPAGEIRYTAVDLQPENVDALPEFLRDWAADGAVSVAGTGPVTVEGPDRRIELKMVAAEGGEYARRSDTQYDLVVGAALLDIVPTAALEALFAALGAGGLYYFPITFDGVTRFRPAHRADRTIESHYHDHMDAKAGGNSRTGTDVLARLQAAEGIGVDAAGSDWVVTPDDGSYPGDEAYVLRYILETVETAVGEITGGACPQLDGWLDRRRGQVEAGELLYLTHQLDLFGRVDDTSGLGGEYDRGSG